MQSQRSLVLVSLVVMGLASACGGHDNTTATTESQSSSGGTSSASPAPSAPGAALAIVPLRILPTADNAHGHAIELRADGTIAADEHVLGRIDGTRILDANGQVALEVTSDGHITAPGHEGAGPELTADGALVAPDGRIVVNADGTIEERRASGEVRPAPFRFENMPANARRTAVAVVAFVTMASASPEPAPAEAHVDAPSSSPPPAAASSAPPAGRRRRAH